MLAQRSTTELLRYQENRLSRLLAQCSTTELPRHQEPRFSRWLSGTVANPFNDVTHHAVSMFLILLVLFVLSGLVIVIVGAILGLKRQECWLVIVIVGGPNL